MLVKYWSDKHVSEDWHLSLRLQIEGFQIRLASYHGDEFKEGVSLTIYDEIARWEKYAYGCNELVFNPLYKWYKGPITSLYLNYYLSCVKTSSKLMALSYTCSYYAIASALPLTFANYMVMGLMPNTVSGFYVSSWKVFFIIVIVFNFVVRNKNFAFPTPTVKLIVRLHRLQFLIALSATVSTNSACATRSSKR